MEPLIEASAAVVLAGKRPLSKAYAASAGVQLPGLSRLYADAEKKQGWLLGYSSLNAQEIETAMGRLAGALKKP